MTPEVWAPAAADVALVRPDGRREAMTEVGGGWFRAAVDLGHGERYAFSLDGGKPLPDPRSHHQPDGVHGFSAVVDRGRFPWTDRAWPGWHLPGSVVYELHVGTFTREGTFDAAVERLDHLVDLGIGAVELMPVAAFAGRRGWGYDGVAWYAPHEAYGGPEGMHRFVDAAHARGLGVVLDVVWNHFGPEGAYAPSFGPYLHEGHHTPWGAAVNLDGDRAAVVRRFVLDNARHWFVDHHVDGLRLDAVHALVDDSAVPILEELVAETEALSAALGRRLTLTAENDTNDARLVRDRAAGGTGLHAVWADDLHHAVHTVLTGERQGYYAPYGRPTQIAKAYRDGFVHDGTWVPELGRRRGRPVGDTDRTRFVVAAQNHDQIGNRAAGERIGHLVGERGAMVAAALVLLAPGTPLLFMGEEWAASTPFAFFCDFGDESLRDGVRRGRRAEFGAFGWADDVPDPLDPATFEASVLRWDELGRRPHADVLAWYRCLMRLRRAYPDLRDGRADRIAAIADDGERWMVADRGRLTIAANLGDVGRDVPADAGLQLPNDGGPPVAPARVVLAASDPAVALLPVAGADGPPVLVRLPAMSVAVIGPAP